MPTIFDYMFEAFCKTEPIETATLAAFVAFCKAELVRNPAIGIAAVQTGLAVKLQDGTVLPFQPQNATPVENRGDMPFTANHGGRSGMVNYGDFGITGR